MKSFSTLFITRNTILFAAVLPINAAAGISYTTPGATYFENFDSLPTDAPNNANIETLYPNGWMDDTATVAGTNVGVPGWYLYHPLSPAENGFNDHQRLRFGPGANTGSFWAFGTATTETDKAMGSIGSTTVAANNANM